MQGIKVKVVNRPISMAARRRMAVGQRRRWKLWHRAQNHKPDTRTWKEVKWQNTGKVTPPTKAEGKQKLEDAIVALILAKTKTIQAQEHYDAVYDELVAR